MNISCHRSHLEDRCRERGYSLDEVMPCVVGQSGDWWTIDTASEFYPRLSRMPGVPDAPPAQRRGPGGELKQILAGWPFHIETTEMCPCNAYAAQMDAWGCDECVRRMDEIVGHLREQAAARGLPFLDAVGRMLVRRAIKNARKNSIDQ
jgi:hypothetical protein